MSEIIEEIAKEHLEKIEEMKEKNKKRREEYEKKWGPFNKLKQKLNEIISELGEYSLFNKLTKEESSKYIELGNCYCYFDNKSKTLRDEQQFSEIMEKLHAVVQEAWDFLGKIRIKYGNIQSIRCRQEWLTGISVLIGFFAFTGILFFCWYSCIGW